MFGDMAIKDLSPKDANSGGRIIKNLRICGSGLYEYHVSEAPLMGLSIPDDYHGEEHLIDLVFTKHYYDSIHYSFHEFLQYAHNNPDKYFVLCDFKETLDIDKNEEQKTAIQFWEWYEHKIPNVIMPFWILNRIAGLDMIGRD